MSDPPRPRARRASGTSARSARARRRIALHLGVALGALATSAHGHHSPGHSASEGIRTLYTLGMRAPRATQRVLLLTEAARATSEPSLNPATIYTTSVLVSLRPLPWFSAGVQAPVTLIDEQAPGVASKFGYGDTRLELRLTPHAERHTEPGAERGGVLTFGLNASFPTRTVRFEVDPGPLWSWSPLVAYARSYEAWSWQAMVLAPIEHRRAGTAFEATAALLFDYRLLDPWTVSAGSVVDVRLASLCALPRGGSEWCAEGRSTERSRGNGSTRAYLTAGSGVVLGEAWTASLSVQVPVTARRDFDVAGGVGVEARF